MSELQFSLLFVGIAVVVAVYAYNGWQQRQYRRKLGSAFQHRHADVLAPGAAEKTFPEKSITVNAADQTPANPEIPACDAMDAVSEFSPAPVPDDNCVLPDAATDYIATLTVKRPVTADVLARLWQQRFDFGKNIYVCGLNAASGAWEKVIAEGRYSYSQFTLALQLVNRAGPVSEGRLSDFRDLVRQMAVSLQAEVVLPDVAQAAARAQQLDKFCAEVDQMIGLNIFPAAGRKFSARAVQQAAEQHGLRLQADGSFHLLDEQANSLFRLGNIDNSPFPHLPPEAHSLDGVTLVLDLPHVAQPIPRFDQMTALAKLLAIDLDGVVTDDRRATLNPHSIVLIREQIAAIESSIAAQGLTPGSAQARRLFS